MVWRNVLTGLMLHCGGAGQCYVGACLGGNTQIGFGELTGDVMDPENWTTGQAVSVKQKGAMAATGTRKNLPPWV